MAGTDETGPHLYQNCPSGNYFEYQAFAIGSRSQAAKTYLERKYETFMGCTKDELIRHALYAVKESLQEEELTSSNCGLALVGIDEKFEILDPKKLQAYIDSMEDATKEEAAPTEEQPPHVAAGALLTRESSGGVEVPADGDGPSPMET